MSKRNPGHTHPTPEGYGSSDQDGTYGAHHVEEDRDAAEASGDSHPKSHADHPYIASAHRFTKPAFHASSKERMKGQDVSTKGDHEYGCY